MSTAPQSPAQHDTSGGSRPRLLSLTLADAAGLRWAQQTVTERHYRRSPVDVRSRPLAYIVAHEALGPVGILMVNRPEATCCRPLWGSLRDVAAGRVQYSYWSICNLCRVWLDPRIQKGGSHHVYDAATWAMGQMRRRVALDYLLLHPPVDCAEPYTLDLLISYNQSDCHQGTIYKAAGFTLARTNKAGLQTYVRPLRGLQPHERRMVLAASEQSERSRRLRAQRVAGGRQLALEVAR